MLGSIIILDSRIGKNDAHANPLRVFSFGSLPFAKSRKNCPIGLSIPACYLTGRGEMLTRHYSKFISFATSSRAARTRVTFSAIEKSSRCDSGDHPWNFVHHGGLGADGQPPAGSRRHPCLPEDSALFLCFFAAIVADARPVVGES